MRTTALRHTIYFLALFVKWFYDKDLLFVSPKIALFIIPVVRYFQEEPIVLDNDIQVFMGISFLQVFCQVSNTLFKGKVTLYDINLGNSEFTRLKATVLHVRRLILCLLCRGLWSVLARLTKFHEYKLSPCVLSNFSYIMQRKSNIIAWWRGAGGHWNDKRGYQVRSWTHRMHPKQVFPGLKFAPLNKYSSGIWHPKQEFFQP